MFFSFLEGRGPGSQSIWLASFLFGLGFGFWVLVWHPRKRAGEEVDRYTMHSDDGQPEQAPGVMS